MDRRARSFALALVGTTLLTSACAGESTAPMLETTAAVALQRAGGSDAASDAQQNGCAGLDRARAHGADPRAGVTCRILMANPDPVVPALPGGDANVGIFSLTNVSGKDLTIESFAKDEFMHLGMPIHIGVDLPGCFDLGMIKAGETCYLWLQQTGMGWRTTGVITFVTSVGEAPIDWAR